MAVSQLPLSARPQFTAQQCSDCDKALRLLVEMEALYPLCEKCGVDVGHYKQINQQLKDSLSAFKHYFMTEHK